MLVILRENVEKLGRVGDVVKVSEGYARNFLLPRELVYVANEKNLAEIEHHKRVLEKRRIAEKAGAEDLAKKIGEYSCTLKRKIGKNDKMFGSVTSADIAAELNRMGFSINKGTIQLKEPIKSLGVHTVQIRLQPEVSASLKVWVVKDEQASE